MQKVPFSIIIGESEVENNTITIRKYGSQESTQTTLKDFVDKIVTLDKTKA